MALHAISIGVSRQLMPICGSLPTQYGANKAQMKHSYPRFLYTTIAVFFAALAALLPAGAHHGADAVITGSQSAPLATTVETAAGTIDELVVDNRVTGTTTRYTLLRRDDGIVVGLRGANSESLIKGTRILATGRRAGDMLQVDSYGVTVGPVATAAIQATGVGTSPGHAASRPRRRFRERPQRIQDGGPRRRRAALPSCSWGSCRMRCAPA